VEQIDYRPTSRPRDRETDSKEGPKAVPGAIDNPIFLWMHYQNPMCAGLSKMALLKFHMMRIRPIPKKGQQQCLGPSTKGVNPFLKWMHYQNPMCAGLFKIPYDFRKATASPTVLGPKLDSVEIAPGEVF
jgi:hypothetical protein